MRRLTLILLVVIAVTIAGCGGKPFNVKPRPDMPAANYEAEARSSVAVVQAAAIKDEDLLYETFDANLIMAGVLPVRVKVMNSSAQPLNLDKARFEITAQSGRSYKAEEARKAYKRLISYYGVSTYTKSGYKESQEDFSSHAIDTKTPLGAGESREGLLFFPVPGDVVREQGLRLQIRRLGPKQSGSGDVIEIGLK